MTYETGEYTLTDIEIKIHDARRRCEGLLDLLKMDIPLPEDEIQNLSHELAEAQRILLNFYLVYKKDLATEEPPTKPTDNVVEFPGNKTED